MHAELDDAQRMTDAIMVELRSIQSEVREMKQRMKDIEANLRGLTVRAGNLEVSLGEVKIDARIVRNRLENRPNQFGIRDRGT